MLVGLICLVQYVCAFDEKKNIVYIEDAIPQNPYFCITCGKEMYPRNQKEEPKREHHFVHHEEADHSGESSLHYNTKCFISKFLDAKCQEGSDFVLKLVCPKQQLNAEKCILYDAIPYGLYPKDCFNPNHTLMPFYKESSYSVLEGIDCVIPEKKIDNSYVPDVSLFQNNKLFRAIEVVYTHEDSEDKTKYYEDNCIDVIKVHVNKDSDFDELETCFNEGLYCNLIEIVINSGICKTITTNQMLVENINQRLFLKDLVFQKNAIEREIDSITIKLTKTKVEFRDLLWDIYSCIPVKSWYEGSFEFEGYFKFLVSNFDNNVIYQKNSLNHFDLEYQYLLLKFNPFRCLFDFVDSKEEEASSSQYALRLATSWAKKKYCSKKALLVILNDGEFNSLIRDYLYLQIDNELYGMLKKWFTHLNTFGWYHYLNSEEEILTIYGEYGLQNYKRTIAKLNSLTEWSSKYS